MNNHNKSILKEDINLYEYQNNYIEKILNSIEKTNIRNYFISLPQGIDFISPLSLRREFNILIFIPVFSHCLIFGISDFFQIKINQTQHVSQTHSRIFYYVIETH